MTAVVVDRTEEFELITAFNLACGKRSAARRALVDEGHGWTAVDRLAAVCAVSAAAAELLAVANALAVCRAGRSAGVLPSVAVSVGQGSLW